MAIGAPVGRSEVLRFRLLHEEQRRGRKYWAMLHPSGLSVNLVTHDGAATGDFDERTVGLDHVAFTVRDRATLEEWAQHLDSLGVARSEIKEENGGPLMTFRDPNNIQLELHAVKSQPGGFVAVPAFVGAGIRR